jgi:hypothetical protein
MTVDSFFAASLRVAGFLVVAEPSVFATGFALLLSLAVAFAEALAGFASAEAGCVLFAADALRVVGFFACSSFTISVYSHAFRCATRTPYWLNSGVSRNLKTKSNSESNI